ncbi:TniQ family protein (plasmid) [Streptomyces sp. NBC_00984]|uniref:TniQ family protein n=1 Tax=Streptomyces sp. NBC_00984 TaxID=2903700 RepID=UPI002F9092C1|nr:TniQ family protein [Streptomyces sp. NBC_00984]
MADTADEPARPLGMSLEPLAGESLNGYLLRLAYRLHLEPNRLTRLLGCGSTPGTRVSRRLHLDLRTDAFARATRLTEAEGEQLTLRPWADRYPPISRSPAAAKVFCRRSRESAQPGTHERAPHALLPRNAAD